MIIVVKQDKSQEYVTLPNRKTKKYETLMKTLEDDPTVVAILTSNPSQDAYEQYLYPKATSKSVEYVLKHYETYFKPILPGKKLRVPL